MNKPKLPTAKCANPDCKQPFSQTRRDRRFCSTRCSYAVWDKKHPRRGVKRHTKAET